MATKQAKNLSEAQIKNLLEILKHRFENNMHRHNEMKWNKIEDRLNSMPHQLWSLLQMEESGGEPDVVAYNQSDDEFLFFDCSPESPKGRRSLCYDQLALESRKANKPRSSAVKMANEFGVELLNETQYMFLQQLGNFDTKTSSWVLTSDDVRAAGGAVFGDRRYGRVFFYHNGAESYYAARGFRSCLKI
ncbi:DUF4256 domain-containing protein [Roseimarinus sediminis]|uniref:DUF4256 domain-containing protein n=1 Tax=Roseimarinus sediminis TaxID=1610899 RepID=UPI003D22912D